MSIFPKRLKPGGSVTVHLNYSGLSKSEAKHAFPFVNLRIQCPDGKIIPLYSGHMLSFPQTLALNGVDFDSEVINTKNILAKSTPYLVIADYLRGKENLSGIVSLLKNMHTGRHFYFPYHFSNDALPGKYRLLAELYDEGEVHHSKNEADDYFFLEKLHVERIVRGKGYFTAFVVNPSPEIVPSRLVEWTVGVDKQMHVSSQILELAPSRVSKITLQTEKALLFYNEDREMLSLYADTSPLCLQNQQLLTLSKREKQKEVYYVFAPDDQENAYKLKGKFRDVWLSADGLTTRNEICNKVGAKAYGELIKNGLIQEIQINR